MPTCEAIREAVAKYNAENSRDDLALRSALTLIQNLPPSLGRFLAEVCLIADWGSIRLDGFPFRDRLAMAGEIETSWPLLETMRSWRAENWDAETLLLTRGVELLSSHSHLLPTPGVKNRQLSFISKYLHRCVNEAFPIWDGNARAAMDHQNDETTWPCYSGWLICVRDEAAKHKACCLEQVGLPGESPVQTLDKALYIIGGEKRKRDQIG